MEVIRESGGCRVNGRLVGVPRWGIGASNLECPQRRAADRPEGTGGVWDPNPSSGTEETEVFRPAGSDLDLGSRRALYRYLGSTLIEEGHPFRAEMGAVPF